LIGAGTKYINNITYTGEFNDGALHGQGAVILPNGDKYSGVFRSGELIGNASCILSNGDSYEGHIENYRLQGKGILKFSTPYDGLFIQSGANGTMFNLEGTSYEGEFNNGFIEGKGSFHFKNGTHFEGTFTRGEDDEIQAHGIYFIDTNTVLEGQFQ